MSTEILVEKYLKGYLKIDITRLDNEDKVRYAQMENLIDDLLRMVNKALDKAEKLKYVQEDDDEHNQAY